MTSYFLLLVFIACSLNASFELPKNFSSLTAARQKELKDARDFALYNNNAGEEFKEIEKQENFEKNKRKTLRSFFGYLCCIKK